jgi:hypothetical protein
LRADMDDDYRFTNPVVGHSTRWGSRTTSRRRPELSRLMVGYLGEPVATAVSQG